MQFDLADMDFVVFDNVSRCTRTDSIVKCVRQNPDMALVLEKVSWFGPECYKSGDSDCASNRSSKHARSRHRFLSTNDHGIDALCFTFHEWVELTLQSSGRQRQIPTAHLFAWNSCM
jgi:hypothetical protein